MPAQPKSDPANEPGSIRLFSLLSFAWVEPYQNNPTYNLKEYIKAIGNAKEILLLGGGNLLNESETFTPYPTIVRLCLLVK